MRILDLFCCQGGAAMGYHRAGFDVTGVDSAPQPRYPFPFTQTAWDDVDLTGYDAIHASPPCQAYSLAQRIRGREHPSLIGPVRESLRATGLPYVIENVEDARAELTNPVTLCGATFGLRTYRHRLFETNWDLPEPAHPLHSVNTIKMGRPLTEGAWYHAVGNFSGVPYVREDMGVGWMSRDGIRECVPPAYTEYVGRALLAALVSS